MTSLKQRFADLRPRIDDITVAALDEAIASFGTPDAGTEFFNAARTAIRGGATDRTSLLKDITIALSDSGANILSAATQVGGQGIVRMRFLVAISDASLLDTLLACVACVPSVYDARRIMPGEGANQMKRRKA